MILSITDLKKELFSFLKGNDLSKIKKDLLVNFVYKIEETNITSLIDPIIKQSRKVFYFNRPEEHLTFLAFNDSLSLRINGKNKFFSLGEKISYISQNMISNKDENSLFRFPLFVGGTKFYTGKNSVEWKDFADNDWFIPRFLFYRKNKNYWLILNFLITKNDNLDKLVNCLLEPVDQLNILEFLPLDDNATIKVSMVNNERTEWNELISSALSEISVGTFRKVVISRRIIAVIKNLPQFNNIVKKLEENYKNCSVFLFKSEHSVLFGATPEQLLKYKDSLVEFDALAGSAKRGENDEIDNKIAENLLRDNKNTEEHNHVIEFIKVASSKFVRNFNQFDTRIKKFSNIQHIYTPIKAELKSSNKLYNLVDEIFPTPAICGYPKGSSLNYIIENENFDRGLFSGIIGFISPEEMDLVVAIRSALLNENKLFIYSGCGIVKGLDPISEFEETEIKMKPILSLFVNES